MWPSCGERWLRANFEFQYIHQNIYCKSIQLKAQKYPKQDIKQQSMTKHKAPPFRAYNAPFLLLRLALHLSQDLRPWWFQCTQYLRINLLVFSACFHERLGSMSICVVIDYRARWMERISSMRERGKEEWRGPTRINSPRRYMAYHSHFRERLEMGNVPVIG